MTHTRLLVCLALLGACGRGGQPGATARPLARPGVRISMADLHKTGGVPPAWRFTPAPGDVDAGRRAFVDLGCQSCHRVEGLSSSAPDETRGPDLTGMGGHHPEEYFVESIVNPDAVLVEGPGWIGPDGRSTMPTYPDVTVRQLDDLVAFLKSLRSGGADMAATIRARPPSEVPAAPPGAATIYYVQVYDVLEGRLQAFQDWFRTEGAAAFLARDGVTGVDTWVDLAHDGPALVTVIGFRDDGALRRFLDDPATDALGKRFDDFIGPHGHRIFRQTPVYRVAGLSAP
jgi:mono/diheme cytochrome c family protein